MEINGGIKIPMKEEYFKDFVTYLIEFIQNDLQLLNIHFDKFTFEKDIVSNQIINELFKILNEKKLLYKGTLEKPKVKTLMIGNLESNCYLNHLISLIIKIEHFKNQMVSGLILQMMQLII